MSDWLDDERRAPGLGRELVRLWRRAASRPLLVLLPALVLAAGAVALRRSPLLPARVVLRVVEGDLEAGAALRPTRHLEEHVLGVGLSDGRLLALMRAEHLYERELRRGERPALEAMRDDIEVEVWRNGFVEEPEPGTPSRSARVAITYRAQDPAVALRVARQLAHLVEDEQHGSRIEEADQAARVAEVSLRDLRAELERRQGDAARRTLELAGSPDDPLRTLRAAGLWKEAAALDAEVRAQSRGLGALAGRRAMERRRIGLQFDVLDEEPPPSRRSPALRLSLLGAATFLIAVPLWAVVVGAFDPRVRDLHDVARLGLRPLGQLSSLEPARPSPAPDPLPALPKEAPPARRIHHG